VWLDDRQGLMQDSTQAVVALYEEGGFEIVEDFRDLPDHVAVELEFLYLLLFRQAEGVRNDDAWARAGFADLHRRLLDQHLGRWIGPFTKAMEAGAQTDFYRELGRLTRVFVDGERVASGAG
jgi:TorA maturation chaperone TorD